MITLRRLFSVLILVSVTSLSHAHTTCVIATRPVVLEGGKTTIFIGWGHLLPVDELVSAEDMKAYKLHTPSGSTTDLELSGRSLQAVEVTLDQPGLYQVEASRKPTIFTRYTKADGVPVFALQPKNEVELPEGAKIDISARSGQFAKALIMCNTTGTSQPLEPMGHALEIIVESTPGPTGFSIDKPVTVKVLFEGEPIPGARVSAASTTLNPSGRPEITAETDAEGRAVLDLYEPGTWVLITSHRMDAPEELRSSFDSDSYLATYSIPLTDDE